MATDALIERLLAAEDGSTHEEAAGDASPMPTVDPVHGLVDGSMIDWSVAPMGIAQAADLVGLSVHTLRYYELQGLVRPARNSSGYREYSANDLSRLTFLNRMRLSGMTMKDLRRYIGLVEQGDSTIPERRRIMFDQRDRIKRRLRELNLALETTEFKIRTYGGHPDGRPAHPHRSPASPA
ncbi:MerR family transcriptional regulator [Microlunatus sp. Gsoil 973]|uniref:MerR family transcriptional regulator n=1 Tax=Microlunatus sp. Gsoil 973 TaxID=2672569 RepID=UPI0012B4CB51|nr:MerR family transcriptional regulator [Microlunatus sp. Gsoil 973]QGN34793.1 MerR family transcriptional regulator [Microlunatus sp. Gsoil 973]